ncbi:MAG TPA: SpoIVB peptidase S55 domain-containing protein [Terriglobales bacterium]|nr:SpoIVB peptidase S55 domain-containing protein [Terriglobales bacterium]
MNTAVTFRSTLASLLSICLLSLLTVAQVKSDKKKIAPAKPAPVTIQKHTPTPVSALKLPELMPLSEIRPGMRGVAKTVFQGTVPEEMGVEILGVMKNANGPQSDIILAKLVGTKPEFTGVVAGMSGSPVYINGKLIGALSFRIGVFSKEPIAGITPIEEMLEINELDSAVPPQTSFSMQDKKSESSSASSPTSSAATSSPSLNSMVQTMTPIAAPLVFNGFSDETLERFLPQFASAGVIPVKGMGGSSDQPQPEPIEPGSSVGIVLARGDMDIAATCTVTYISPERLLACGHPIFQFGKVDMPMTKSTVMATLASQFNAFKIASATETIGSFKQDRHTGIMGRFGEESRMVPVTVTLHGGTKPKVFKYEMMNNPKLTPILVSATVFNALQALNEHGEESTYRMRGKIDVNGYPSVRMQNMYAPGDLAPTTVAVAMSVGDKFSRIYDNAYQTPDIKGIELEFDLVRERRLVRLESARTDVTEARPGEEVTVEVVLRPYRGDRIVRQVPVRIPTSTPKGNLRILVSDGETLDRARRVNPAFGRKLDLAATIATLNKDRVNSRLYVSLLEANPQAIVEDKVMPTLPLSVMNVMEGMRGTQDMVVSGESAVNEASTPLDYVVAGAQVISIRIK